MKKRDFSVSPERADSPRTVGKRRILEEINRPGLTRPLKMADLNRIIDDNIRRYHGAFVAFVFWRGRVLKYRFTMTDKKRAMKRAKK